MSATTRVLVLDDGDTWEELPATSMALVVEVPPADIDRLRAGERACDVLPGRRGLRVAWLASNAAPPEPSQGGGKR